MHIDWVGDYPLTTATVIILFLGACLWLGLRIGKQPGPDDR